MGYDTGIAARLRTAGLNVVEVAGWQTRGASTFDPRGLVDHHTAGPRTGNIPSLGVLINGRAGLPGPLCNIATARDNTIYVVAAGRANHAGEGGWRGLSGNSSVYGNERENVGTSAEPWRPDQHAAAARANAALLRGRGIDAAMHCEHKEWTTRKPDAHTVPGDHMRALVRSFLSTPGEPPTDPPNPDKVRPMFDPLHVLEPIADAKAAPEGGVLLLAGSGAIYAYGGAVHPGGCNGQPWFAGRKAARLDYVGPADGKGRGRWQVTATSGETYRLPL